MRRLANDGVSQLHQDQQHPFQFQVEEEYYSYEGSSQFNIPKKNSQLRKIEKGRGHQIWTIKDKLVYVKYLQQYKRCFRDESARRRYRVFKGLSDLLPNKSPQECRRHHQTYQQRFHENVELIIAHLKEKLAFCFKKNAKTYQNSYKQIKKQFLSTVATKQWYTIQTDGNNFYFTIDMSNAEEF